MKNQVKVAKLNINLRLSIAHIKYSYFTVYEEVCNLSEIPPALIKFIFENFKCKLIKHFNFCSDNGYISDENIAKNHHAPILKRQAPYIHNITLNRARATIFAVEEQ